MGENSIATLCSDHAAPHRLRFTAYRFIDHIDRLKEPPPVLGALGVRFAASSVPYARGARYLGLLVLRAALERGHLV